MNNKQNAPIDPEVKIEVAIEKTESYIERNLKPLLIGVAVIIVGTAAYFGFNASNDSKAKVAAEQMFVAQQYFQVDSFEMALNGSAEFEGFLSIADEYSSTSVGNVANQYAAICYYKMGQYDNALASLEAYKAVDGLASGIVNAQNIGLKGDINSEQGNYKEAASYYIEASKIENDLTAPIYLKKAGLVYEKLGDNNKALEAYTTIKDKYFRSSEAQDIEKFIGRVDK